MRALSTRLMILCFILISAILLSPFALPPFASGASIETNTQINMGTVLDALLWSKPIDMLQAVSPWKNRDLITPDNNVTTPQARVPFYSIVGGSP
ncbi:MAG: hypothetical protein KAH38_00890, partial [Candidatus Hydrogenedentes bacterium]|nr:hypothetical protein [Candidatus Hydrogenedentota bacterium]